MNLAIKLTTLALVGASTNVYAHDLRGSVANTVSDSVNSVVSFSRSSNASLISAHLLFSLSYISRVQVYKDLFNTLFFNLTCSL